MRISTAIVSGLVAAGSLSLSMQYAVQQQSVTPTLYLGEIPLAANTENPTAAASAPAPQATDTSAPQTEADPQATQTESAANSGSTIDSGSTSTSAPSSTATATAEPTSQPTQSADPQATATATSAPAQSEPAPAPAETSAPAAEPAPAQPVVVKVVSDVIEYKYGVVQISLTTTDGKITSVTLLQGDASYGRDVAYQALINATIQTQGINYGNVSGATFTTDAFKKAVSNAISKL